MHPVIYDVAVSLDGFICGPDGDVSHFSHDGAVVEDYQSRLAGYSCAIMGRTTYEFGYAYGLRPGQNPYPHMKTYVFSSTLECPVGSEITTRRSLQRDEVMDLKETAHGPIYLCGGGRFAGAMLGAGLIDRVIFKRAPVVLGRGVPVFDSLSTPTKLRRVSSRLYDNGYVLEEFTV